MPLRANLAPRQTLLYDLDREQIIRYDDRRASIPFLGILLSMRSRCEFCSPGYDLVMPEWPDFFPPCDCPPHDAQPATGCVYRILSGEEPAPGDFRSHREMFPEQKFDDECDACGLSVYAEAADAVRMRRRIPRLRKGTIAIGTLKAVLGKIKYTSKGNRDSHHTWWLTPGIEPWLLFEAWAGE